jgi:hypothetical protein
VTDAHAMYVLDPRYYLLKELAALLLLQPFSFHDVVEELAAVRVLHDQKQLLRGLDDLSTSVK